tara:strand:+ start:16215 stop:17141 length:927 start_codon:yes stop_codon:yes gene_type:complete
MLGQAIGSLAGGVIGLIGAGKRRRAAQAEAARARAEMDRMKSVYTNLDTSNPYANLENQFGTLTNQYAGLENTMEDLTVNQQQAQFEAQQFQQSQANIMDTMRGAAGGSGIAALAQTLANQGQLAAQRSAASIGQQEAQNQMAAARQAGQLQQMEAQGAAAVDLQRAQGAAQVDQMRAAGERQSQQMEFSKQGTLLGMAQSESAARQQALAQAEQQRMESLQQTISGGVGLASAAFSDRRLKKNIKLIGNSPSGLKIYSFEYINKLIGDKVYQGVMSDEIPECAVLRHVSGYDAVDYSKLDVEFKIIK